MKKQLGRFSLIKNKSKKKTKKGVGGNKNNSSSIKKSMRNRLIDARHRYRASIEEDTYKLTIPLFGWNSKLKGKMRKYKVSRFKAQNIYNDRELCTHGLTTIVKKSENLKNILTDINKLIRKSGEDALKKDCLINNFIIGENENETFGKLYKGKTTIIQVESKYNDKLFNPTYMEGDEIVGLRKIIALELTAN